jgi:hypothetical protein
MVTGFGAAVAAGPSLAGAAVGLASPVEHALKTSAAVAAPIRNRLGTNLT